MVKRIFTLALFLFSAEFVSAQTIGTPQNIGMALYYSLKNNNEGLIMVYLPSLADYKIIREAKSTPEDSTILKFLAQSTAKKLSDDWTATKNKLEANSVIWDKCDIPAVSHEPYQGDGKREHTIVQVMFSCNGKQHTASVRCVNVNNKWYAIESIQPNGQEVK